MHVLLIDENPNIAKLLEEKMSLQEHYLFLSYVENLHCALCLLKVREPTLIILSLSAGLNIYYEVKKHTEAPIVVTDREDSSRLTKIAINKEAYGYVLRCEDEEEYAARLSFVTKELAKHLATKNKNLSLAVKELEETDSQKNRLKTIRKICAELSKKP